MFISQSEYSEIICLFGNKNISKQMPFSEFEAILDGYATTPEVAGQQIRAAYIIVDYRLHITACVLFLVDFAPDGSINKSWNIPLRHMAEIAGPGPDLGSGPIRLVCRSQCPISWHQSNLWDPSMGATKDDFRAMVALVKENRLCLPVHDRNKMNTEGAAQTPTWAMHHQAYQTPMHPWVTPPPYQWGGSSMNQGAWSSAPAHWANAQHGVAPWQTSPLQAVYSPPQTVETGHRTHRAQEDRQRTARLLRKLRLQIHTLENSKNIELAELKYAQQKEAEHFKVQKRRLQSFVDNLTEQNEALKEQIHAQKAQLDTLTQSAEIRLEQAAEHEKREIRVLKQHFQKRLEENEVEEIARLRELYQVKEMELIYKEEITNQLREEVVNLRREKIRLVGAGADKFLAKLEKLGISFINYHPGVGHLSIPLQDMANYIEDTDAYVAEKCLIPKQHYLKWRAHYDNPMCNCEPSSGTLCGVRIPRLESPAKFVEGESDRCAKHRRHAGNDDFYSELKLSV